MIEGGAIEGVTTFFTFIFLVNMYNRSGGGRFLKNFLYLYTMPFSPMPPPDIADVMWAESVNVKNRIENHYVVQNV